MKYRPLAIRFLPGPSRRLAGPGPSGPWPWSSYATVLQLWYDIFCSILEWLMDFGTPLIGFCIWTNRMTNGRNTHRLSGYRDSYVGSLRGTNHVGHISCIEYVNISKNYLYLWLSAFIRTLWNTQRWLNDNFIKYKT